MGRLRPELRTRVKKFSHRVVDVAEALESSGRSRRIVDQIIACGTSVSANLAEADEALSRADFLKSFGIVIKELHECIFWLEFSGERSWLAEPRLTPLLAEAAELKLIFGSIVTRTRQRSPKKS